MTLLRLTVAALLLASGASVSRADEVYALAIKDHHFVPDRLEIPAETKVVVLVKNNDPTPEEFDSHDLKREKVVPAGKEVTLQLGPLKAGSYAFIGEYHEDQAKGVLVAR